MRTRAMLFTAMALIEVGAGLSLLVLPALGISLLLGVGDPALEALVVARICGAGVLALGVACWLARDDRGSRSQDGLLWGMLIYNIGACSVLALAGLPTAGVALWPVVALHGAMTIWCALNLRGSAASQALK
jgi:hypothetical protein